VVRQGPVRFALPITTGTRGVERVETLTARAPIVIRTWRVIVPTTGTASEAGIDGVRWLVGREARLEVAITTPWRVDAQTGPTGDSPDGKGARGPIPIKLIYRPVTFGSTRAGR
jgi:hypothetical protein